MSFLSPVVIYHGLGYRHLMPPALIVRPQLNGGTLGGRLKMYGVPADLPVNAFVGQEFNQICLGRFQIQFHASGTGSISVEGHWALHDEKGGLVDVDRDHAERDAFRLHQIIDVPIVRSSVDPPRAFSLQFENGWTLTISDDTPQYESFSVQLDGQPTLYV